MSERLTVETPPPLADVVALFTGGGAVRAIDTKIAIMHWWKSETYGFRDRHGEIVAVIGYCPVRCDDGGRAVEMWFACRPSIVPLLVAIARVVRLTLTRLVETNGTMVLARVALGHEPGQRLARLIGLKRGDVHEGFELWVRSREGLRDDRGC